MPKTKQQKHEAVGSLTTGMKQAKGIVFANFQGLTVAKAEELRKNCRKENIEVLAAKKTLVRKALEEAGIMGVDKSIFDGGVATFMGMNDEVVAAKIVNDFAKTNDIVKLFGGVLEGKFIDARMVKNLASLPGKQQLLGQVVGTLNAPIVGFVNASAGILRGLYNVLNAYKDKKAV